MVQPTGEITWSLKEWAIAVKALLSGELILLIRKGGIREQQGTFRVPSNRVLLFPTYEHQQSRLLRPPYSTQIEQRPALQIGEALEVPGWAQITHQISLAAPTAVLISALEPFHIWNADWVTQRLSWKPERPAHLLLLRVYRFKTPLVVSYQRYYGGCRSWIQLATPLEAAGTPVVSTEGYNARVEAIHKTLALSDCPVG